MILCRRGFGHNSTDLPRHEIKSQISCPSERCNSDDALADVHANYDRLQHDINQAIQTAEDGIANNSVDAGYLQPGLVVLGSQAIALQDSLIPIAHPVSEAGMGTGILEFLRWVLDNALATWRELFGKKDEMDRAAERQLDQTKWPDWNSIEKQFRNLVAEATTRCTQLIVRSAAALLVGTVLAASPGSPAEGGCPSSGENAKQVKIAPGTKIAASVRDRSGSYESIKQVLSVSPSGVRFSYSASHPDRISKLLYRLRHRLRCSVRADL